MLNDWTFEILGAEDETRTACAILRSAVEDDRYLAKYCTIRSGEKSSAPATLAHAIDRLSSARPHGTFVAINKERLGVSYRRLLQLTYPDLFFHFWQPPFCAPERIELLRIAVRQFAEGHRSWFDIDGQRRSIRAEYTEDRESAEETQRPCCRILEDEREYRDALAYVAYRTGRFNVDAPALASGATRLIESIKNSRAAVPGVLIHALDFAFLGPLPPNTPEPRLRDGECWSCVLLENRLRRSAITGAAAPGLVLIDPATDGFWEVSGLVPGHVRSHHIRLGWSRAERDGCLQREFVRGLRKPLGWLHEILESGLYSLAGSPPERERDEVLATYFDGESNVRQGPGHSAVPLAQGLAERLVQRSHRVSADGEHLLAAVMALDAARLLKARTLTLFLDAVAAMHCAEAKAEIELAATMGGGARSVVLRSTELRALLDFLEVNHEAPRELLKSWELRTWMQLREIYRNAGFFEASEEALLQRHRTGTRHGRLQRKLRVVRRKLRILWRDSDRG